jgi:hypothetical protein
MRLCWARNFAGAKCDYVGRVISQERNATMLAGIALGSNFGLYLAAEDLFAQLRQ